MRTPKRRSNSRHRSGGQPADRTVRTGLSASSGRRRLLEQDRDHAAERVELDRLVAAAVVQEARGAEPLGERQLGVEHHRARSPTRAGRCRGTAAAPCTSSRRAGRPSCSRIEQQRVGVVAGGDHALGRPGRPRRVHHADAAGRLGELDVRLAVGTGHQPVEVPVDAVTGLAVDASRCDATPADRRARPSARRGGRPARITATASESARMCSSVAPALGDVDRHRVGRR